MYGAVRRYDGVDESRRDELVAAIREDFIPRLSETPGLQAYYVIDAGGGVLASVTICDSREAAESSIRAAADFIREGGLGDVLPNPPQVTAGEVTVENVPARASA
jgi:hypothetical protein